MSKYSRTVVGMGILSLCSSSFSSILHNSSRSRVMMGPVKKEKDLFSDGMWCHKESSPGGSMHSLPSTTPITDKIRSFQMCLQTNIQRLRRPHLSVSPSLQCAHLAAIINIHSKNPQECGESPPAQFVWVVFAQCFQEKGTLAGRTHTCLKLLQRTLNVL